MGTDKYSDAKSFEELQEQTEQNEPVVTEKGDKKAVETDETTE